MSWFEYLPYVLLCLFLLEPMAEAVRLTHKFNDMPFVREPADQGVCHFLVPKNRIPVTKTQVASDDDRHALVEVTDELKEHLCPFTINREESQFIQDQQIELDKLGGEAREAQVLSHDSQLIHELRRSVEAHPFPLSARCQR